MGLGNREEEQHTALEMDESLPLYQESPEDVELADLTSPAPEARPDEVREYLVKVMCNRGITAGHARSIASRWTLGTGKELRSYPVAMYRDIFGPDGWVIYKEVKTKFYQAEARKRPLPKMIKYVALVLGLISFGGGFTVIFLHPDSPFAGVAIAVLMMVAMPSLTIALVSFFGPNVEGRAERELQISWEKRPASGQ